MWRLALLFILVPILEIAILIDIGRGIGTVPTILLIIGTGIAGAYLAKKEGIRILFTIRHKLARGQIPADELIDGLLVLIAGVLLITPGVITDIAGLLMLIPFLRLRLRNRLKQRFSGNINLHANSYNQYDDAS